MEEYIETWSINVIKHGSSLLEIKVKEFNEVSYSFIVSLNGCMKMNYEGFKVGISTPSLEILESVVQIVRSHFGESWGETLKPNQAVYM